jgi:membrane associated rhomboid family serine protease
MAKGDGLFVTGTSLMVWCALALIFVLVAWAVGGTEFKDSIFGDAAILLTCTGIVAGAAMDYLARKRRRES